MAEDVEMDAGPENPAHILALSGASRDKADAYLELQMEEMRAEEPYKLSHYRLRRFSDYAKAAFEFSIGLLALALVGTIAVMLWNAAHSDGLIVESFTVPPDLAERGLSGQVVAGQLTDRLLAMQAGTSGARASKSYSNNWGDDLKVEIPETGVSIGEAYRFLKSWLGHETHVSGEVWKTDAGLSIAARVSGGGSSTFAGTAADLDGLIQKTAEDIYSRTQSYRYANYLAIHGRPAEALSVYKALALTGPASERGWGYVGWANMLTDTGSPEERERLLKAGMQYGVTIAAGNLGTQANTMGRPELALALWRKARAMARSDSGMAPSWVAPLVKTYDASVFAALADYRVAVQAEEDAISLGVTNTASPSFALAQYQVLDHDLPAARASLANPVQSSGLLPASDQIGPLNGMAQIAVMAEDWNAAETADQAAIALQRKYPGRMATRLTSGNPRSAIIAAHLGRFAEAEALLRPTPADCYPCLRARAQVAELQGQHERANWWFARAVASNPTIPLADSEWGQSMLDRGDPDGAIAKFTIANQKGPKFADPLEMWGEALMAKNQSHLALAKFAEAEKYAPNWGRLHLKWGEALTYAGKKDEAKAQFARAATLDLTASEKAELARQSPHA